MHLQRFALWSVKEAHPCLSSLHHADGDEDESGAKAYVVMCFLLLLGLHVGLKRAFDNQFCPACVQILKSCFMHDCILQGYWLCFALHALRTHRHHAFYVDLLSVWYENRVNIIVKTLMAHIRINRGDWGYGLIFLYKHTLLYIYKPPIICTPFVPVEKRKAVRKIMKKYCYILE